MGLWEGGDICKQRRGIVGARCCAACQRYPPSTQRKEGKYGAMGGEWYLKQRGRQMLHCMPNVCTIEARGVDREGGGVRRLLQVPAASQLLRPESVTPKSKSKSFLPTHAHLPRHLLCPHTCCATFSGSAAGRSTLFTTGTSASC